MEYETIDRVAGKKGVKRGEKRGFARMQLAEEGAHVSVMGDETGADFAACGECGETVGNAVGLWRRDESLDLRMYRARLEVRSRSRPRCKLEGETGFGWIGQNP